MSHTDKYMPMTLEVALDMFNKMNLPLSRFIIEDGFAMNLSLDRSKVGGTLLNILRTPFLLKDNRLIRIISGNARMEINFSIYDLRQGDILFVKENSYFEVLDISDDAKGEIMVYIPDKYNSEPMMASPSVTHIHPTEKQWEKLSHLFYTIYTFASSEPYQKSVVEPLVVAFINHILHISAKDGNATSSSSQEHIFKHFIEELNKSKGVKHSVAYYAEKLCITPQYLSKVTSQISGKSVSEWINKAVILEARILIRDHSRTISEISDLLNFPSDSSFCRFFKRETGQTPMQYRSINAFYSPRDK